MNRWPLRWRSDHSILMERVPATVTQHGHGLSRLLCWALRGHDWSRWGAGQSGWPIRYCHNCGAKQIRMDASW